MAVGCGFGQYLAPPAGFRSSLPHDAEEVRGAGGFELNLVLHRAVIEPIQNLFVLLRLDHLFVGDLYAAAHRDEQEKMKRIGSQSQSQVERLRQFRGIMFGDRGVDLERHAEPLEVVEAFQRFVERPRDAPERIVSRGVRPVQADGHAPNARFANFAGHVRGDQCPVGAQGDPDSPVRSPSRQAKHVSPKQRFASAQHQDEGSIGSQLINDLDGLVVTQVVRGGKVCGGGAAVDAAQVAPFGQLPKYQPGTIGDFRHRRFLPGLAATNRFSFSGPALVPKKHARGHK